MLSKVKGWLCRDYLGITFFKVKPKLGKLIGLWYGKNPLKTLLGNWSEEEFMNKYPNPLPDLNDKYKTEIEL